MRERINEIYKIEVINYPDNRTEISKVIDPLFDAKLLLEGVGVLVGEISKYSKTHPIDLKKKVWDMEREDVLQLLHDYLDTVGKDYKETAELIKGPFNL